MKCLSFLFAICLAQIVGYAQSYRNDHQSHTKTGSVEKQNSYGKNILAFSPVQMIITNIDQDAPDVAIAFSYERILENNLIGAKLPVSISLKNNYLYFMPTLKFYPMKQGMVKYAVGPQFLIGSGNGTYQEYYQDPQTGFTIQRSVTKHRKQLGFLINNSVNFTFAKSFYASIDGSLGITYYDNLPKDYNTGISISPFSSSGSGIQPSLLLNFNMGFRF
jgi:hypothetical protein